MCLLPWRSTNLSGQRDDNNTAGSLQTLLDSAGVLKCSAA